MPLLLPIWLWKESPAACLLLPDRRDRY